VAADQDAIKVTFLPEAAEPQQRTDGFARPRPGMHQDICIKIRPLPQLAA
jgi:hypothetical protein